MEELQEDLKIYSEEVRDVLSSPPKAIYKWGNTILLFFIILLGALSWSIKYPDIIRAEVVITTKIPPEKLVAKTSGRIKKIFFQNYQEVKANSPIAVIENSADYENLFLLKSITDTLHYGSSFKFPLEKYNFTRLGEVENAYAAFKNNYLAYQQYVQYKPYQVEKKSQIYESGQQKNRVSLLKEQIQIAEKELQLKKNELARYKILHDKGIIATQDWETREFDFLQQEKNQKNLRTQLSQLNSAINDLGRNQQTTNISELKDDVLLLQNTIQSFNQLKKAIADWDLNYVLRSSTNGKLSFFQVWSENQTINSGEQVFSVIPLNSENYISKMRVPALNSGKMKEGQDVIIRLANYPDREFGVLKAKISAISLVPNNEGLLLLDAKLTNNLKTTYDKKIIFQQEMTGTADIITEDLRLIERLLYQFRDVFKR